MFLNSITNVNIYIAAFCKYRFHLLMVPVPAGKAVIIQYIGKKDTNLLKQEELENKC